MIRPLILLLIGSLTAGCAGERALRNTSTRTAGILTQYRSGLAAFADDQTQLNAANQARLAHLKSLRDERTSEIQGRQTAWKLGGRKAALEEFSLLTQRDAASILGTEAVLLAAKPAENPPVPFDPGAVNGVVKQLVALQRPRSTRERAEDFLQFTAELRTSINESIEAASDDTEGAAAATALDAALPQP
jgi:hypothetical protein